MKRPLCILVLVMVFLFFSGVSKNGSTLQFKDHPIPGIPSTSYLRKKSKCFQCENQIARHSGADNVGATHSTKCFTCGDNPLLWRDGVMQHKKPIMGV